MLHILSRVRTMFTGPRHGADMLPVPSGKAAVDGAVVRVREFQLDVRPVTNAEFSQFVEATGARRPEWMHRRGFGDPEQPVVGVALHEAAAFAIWAGKRLPTEAEWIRAARAAATDPYPWGDGYPALGYAWFGRPAKTGAPAIAGPCHRDPGVGPFGHHDLCGNVWEWCKDGVLKGGFWGSDDVRIDDRLVERSDRISAGIGFRCAS